jgi:hypothetical protein
MRVMKTNRLIVKSMNTGDFEIKDRCEGDGIAIHVDFVIEANSGAQIGR